MLLVPDVGGHVHFTRANQSDSSGGNVQQAQSEACLDLLHSLLTYRGELNVIMCQSEKARDLGLLLL